MNEEKKDRVDNLNDTLYSRTRYHSPVEKRSTIRPIDRPVEEAEVEEKWHSPELAEVLTRERVEQSNPPFMKKFFVFAVLFFMATILVAGFVFFGGVNFISSKNVNIEVVGPTLVSAGERLDFGITISNKNNTDLEFANFSVQYPTGSRDSSDSSKSLTYTRDELGVIKAGDEVARNVEVVIIGGTGDVKEFKFSVEYKVKGSNATFYKDKVYQVTIGSAPLSLSVESPDTVTSGEEFITLVTVGLNSSEMLRNVMLKAEYPYGYNVGQSSPEAVSENNVWALGDLTPGTFKTVEIRGRLVGENLDERTMRFYAGVADSGSSSANFKTVILSTQNTIAIEKPSIALSATFNGDNSTTYVAPAGQNISTMVRFQNNLPEKLLNPRLEVRLTGGTLNKSTITVQNTGFYDSLNSRINWSLVNLQGLQELAPGEGGSVSFTFASVPEATTLANRDITLQFILVGTTQDGSRAITITENRSVKIASQVTLSSRALHSIGAFKNTGPIPPKVDQATTYSIGWSVGNTQSDITEAKVTAKLGPGVKWVGAKSENSEDISYNEASNTITWNLGTLVSGTGFANPPREVAFQVTLTPSLSQVGSLPVLVNNIAFTGFDTLSSKTVTVNSPALSTRTATDPAFIQGDDIVVK